MSYREITGCLIDSAKSGDFSIIAHGCNCFNTMGGGIAKAISYNFPEAYTADCATEKGSYNKLGSLSLGVIDNGTYIANLYSQYEPGRNADILALELSLKKLAHYMHKFKLDNLGLCQIGCGIGGLSWDKVKPIVKRQLHQFDVTVVIFNKE